MGVIERISEAIAAGDGSLSGAGLEARARRMLESESPWRIEQSLVPVIDRVLGLGILQPLLSDSLVTDILVNGPDQVWVDRGDGLTITDLRFESVEEIVTTVERAIAPLGLRIDRSAPMVDARLGDGSRLHAVLPPAAVDSPLVAIRRFTQRVRSIDDLVANGTVSGDQAALLTDSVASRSTLVISGGTGAGKTTLLGILGAAIPSDERTVTIEDAAELRLPGHVVRLEARSANTEGTGEITLRSLLRSALRLRPDRIILGEVRGPEALDLITALNTGHRGSMTTVHANSPLEAMWRLETLALSAGHPSETAITRQLYAAVDLVVQIERTSAGRRVVAIEHVEDQEGGTWS